MSSLAVFAALGIYIWYRCSQPKAVVRRPHPVRNRNFSSADKRTIWHRSRGRCQHSGRGRCGGQLQYDHIRPFSKGGASTAANGQLLCARHNSRKSNHFTG